MTTTIHSLSSKWYGEEADPIESLFGVLAEHALSRVFERFGNFVHGWRAVPDRALVAVDTPHGRLYALRSGRLGLFVGGPASWCGEDDEPGWTWDLAWEHGEALLVALSVPAGDSADHLRQLAEDFERTHARGDL